MRRPFYGDHAPFEIMEDREVINRAAHAIQLLQFAIQIHTLTINTRNAVVIELELRSWWPFLDTVFAEAKMPRLFLDLVGLLKTRNPGSQEEPGMLQPLSAMVTASLPSFLRRPAV
jgi:hypothetical protein